MVNYMRFAKLLLMAIYDGTYFPKLSRIEPHIHCCGVRENGNEISIYYSGQCSSMIIDIFKYPITFKNRKITRRCGLILYQLLRESGYEPMYCKI